MGKRAFQRSMARHLYKEFCARWRHEKNLAGLRGKPGYQRPTFAQWNAMHLRDHAMMAESTPQDVQEHLGLDPWAEQPSSDETVKALDQGIQDVIEGNVRGVAGIDLGDDDGE